MALVTDFYTITGSTAEGDATIFHVALNPDCDIYRGHFPGAPVAPGVCNIQMLKECAEQLAGRPLMLSYIQQCRMTALITPHDCPTLDIRIQLDGDTLQGTIFKGEQIYLTLKGTVS